MLEPKKPEEIKQEKPTDNRIYIVVPYRALKDKRFTIQRMRALLTICSYANHTGNAWPSVERMAEDMGIMQPTMQAHIKWLTEKGYLVTINNSYTVGKHAKPRAIVYDPNNPPDTDLIALNQAEDTQQEQENKTIKEQQANLVESMQSKSEVLAKPTSLYRVWRESMLKRFGVDQPYEKELYIRLSHRYTLEGFKKATQVYLNSKGSPPASVKVMLRD
jgi:DNA-binding transcriptional regulator YhcF (GntR family)